jgi:hypothetical protein
MACFDVPFSDTNASSLTMLAICLAPSSKCPMESRYAV